jgi:hypothetical protein
VRKTEKLCPRLGGAALPNAFIVLFNRLRKKNQPAQSGARKIYTNGRFSKK